MVRSSSLRRLSSREWILFAAAMLLSAEVHAQNGTPVPPAGDACAGAIVATLGSNPGTTSGATYDPAGSCNGGDPNVWMSFTPGASDNYAFSISVSGSAQVGGVYRGACGALIPVLCANEPSVHAGGLTAGVTYYIEVRDWQPSGAFSLDIATYVPPANDACAAAAVATVGSNPVTTVGATFDGDGDCNNSDADVWFLFTPPATGAYSFAVNGAANADVQSISTGTCGARSIIECASSQSVAIDGLQAGVTYYVEISDWTSSETFTLDIASVAPVAGDACSTAFVATLGSNPGTTAGATWIAGGGCSSNTPNVWYTFTPAANGDYLFSVTGSGSASVGSVSLGACGALSAITCPFNPNVTVDGLTAGVTYYIEVVDWSPSGPFSLDISTAGPAAPGDSCSTALPATVGSNPGDTTGATWIANGPCNGGNANVWFEFVPAASGDYSFSISGGTTQGLGAVLVGPCSSATTVACADGQRVNVTGLTAGTQYLIEVQDYQLSGAFFLDIAPFVPAANDECFGAVALPFGLTSGIDNFTTTDSPGVTCARIGADLWYTYTPACNGTYSVSTVGHSTDDTVVAIYAACGGPSIACNDDTDGGSQSRAIIDMTAGVTYLIRLGGYRGRFIQTGLEIGYYANAFAITFTTTPGAVSMSISGGTPYGVYFAPLTFNHGNFPNGSFFGIDIAFADLLVQATAGLPFIGALDACGTITNGPYLGVPAGWTLYSVALDNIYAPFITASAPKTFTTL